MLKPVAEHGRYDMAFEIGDRIYRVQCKWGNLDDAAGVIKVNLASTWYGPNKSVRRSYLEHEIDFVAVYCGRNDRCYLLSSSLVANRRAIYLRVAPAKNRQVAFTNLASNFEFEGAIAQLEERRLGMAEVVGSSPTSSTPVRPPTAVIGAEEFRNRLGWYMERAAAGEEFHVERRGRPYIRLTGAAPQLRLSTDSSFGQQSRGVFVGRYGADKAAA